MPLLREVADRLAGVPDAPPITRPHGEGPGEVGRAIRAEGEAIPRTGEEDAVPTRRVAVLLLSAPVPAATSTRLRPLRTPPRVTLALSPRLVPRGTPTRVAPTALAAVPTRLHEGGIPARRLLVLQTGPPQVTEVTVMARKVGHMDTGVDVRPAIPTTSSADLSTA